MQTPKILILDGIGGISLGREIAQALQALHTNTIYLNSAHLQKKTLYKIRAALHKAARRQLLDETFYYFPKVDDRAISQLIEQEQPDIVLVIGFLYRFISPQLITKLKQRLGFRLFLFDTDSCNLFAKKRELVYFVKQELPIYDHIFSCSKAMAELFHRTNGLNSSFFPFGANIIKQPQTTCYNNDILFAGSADMRRIFLLENLTHLSLSIFGVKWRRNETLISPQLQQHIQDKPLWGKELHHQIASSKIVLNITRSTFYGVETGLNLRIFEALAAGAFLLTDYSDELCQLLTPGKEVETYRNAAELVEKAEYYLAHDEERKTIAQQGHAALKARFTWQHRAEALLEKISLLHPSS